MPAKGYVVTEQLQKPEEGGSSASGHGTGSNSCYLALKAAFCPPSLAKRWMRKVTQLRDPRSDGEVGVQMGQGLQEDSGLRSAAELHETG